jgi:hypothetical protein
MNAGHSTRYLCGDLICLVLALDHLVDLTISQDGLSIDRARFYFLKMWDTFERVHVMEP